MLSVRLDSAGPMRFKEPPSVLPPSDQAGLEIAPRSRNTLHGRMRARNGTSIKMFRRRLTTSSTTDQFCTAGLAASMRLRLSCSCSWSGELADNERNGSAKAVSFSCLSNNRQIAQYQRCRVSGAAGANAYTPTPHEWNRNSQSDYKTTK